MKKLLTPFAAAGFLVVLSFAYLVAQENALPDVQTVQSAVPMVVGPPTIGLAPEGKFDGNYDVIANEDNFVLEVPASADIGMVYIHVFHSASAQGLTPDEIAALAAEQGGVRLAPYAKVYGHILLGNQRVVDFITDENGSATISNFPAREDYVVACHCEATGDYGLENLPVLYSESHKLDVSLLLTKNGLIRIPNPVLNQQIEMIQPVQTGYVGYASGSMGGGGWWPLAGAAGLLGLIRPASPSKTTETKATVGR